MLGLKMSRYAPVMDIVSTGATRKFGIIDITTCHHANFCLLHTQSLE